jgi:hypothetical protein
MKLAALFRIHGHSTKLLFTRQAHANMRQTNDAAATIATDQNGVGKRMIGSIFESPLQPM